jgi:hypothetical protein
MTTKNLINLISIFISIFIFWYFIFSFSLAEINFKNWTFFSRGTMMLLFFYTTFISIIYYKIKN